MNDGIRQATVIEPVMVPRQRRQRHAQQRRRQHAPAPAEHRHADRRRGQRQHRTDRQVDAADDQHEGHADRQHHQVRNLVGQGAEGVVRQEMAAQRTRTARPSPARRRPAPGKCRGRRSCRCVCRRTYAVVHEDPWALLRRAAHHVFDSRRRRRQASHPGSSCRARRCRSGAPPRARRCGRRSASVRAGRWTPPPAPCPGGSARRAARRCRTWRQRRCRGSARRTASPSSRAPASARSRLSAGCRRTDSDTDCVAARNCGCAWRRSDAGPAPISSPWLTKPPLEITGMLPSAMFALIDWRQQQAFALAVFGDQGDAMPDRIRRRTDTRRPAPANPAQPCRCPRCPRRRSGAATRCALPRSIRKCRRSPRRALRRTRREPCRNGSAP